MHSSMLSRNEPPPVPQAALLPARLAAQAARTPQATAIIWEGERMTYAALSRAAGRLAARLRARGVGPETLVGVSLVSSPAQVIALLGILQAGAAYLPLDPDYPRERLAFMLTDSRASLLVSQTELRARLPEGAWETLCLEEPWEDRSASPVSFSLPAPESLAYVIYTSGSTGVPKGVAVTHGSVAANLRWRQETFPLSSDDRLLQTYSFSFDPSVWAFFWPLTAGATLVLPRPGGIADSRHLAELMAGQEITVMGAGPAVWDVLLTEPAASQCQSLRHAFSGGEALTGNLRRRFLAQFPRAQLHNVYGPTEATIDAAWWTCPRPDTGENSTPIGFPLPHASVHVLDAEGRQVAAGEAGELYIGGGGLARGYLFRQELTEQRFITNPFDMAPGARLYRTGDLARFRPDGALEYLGRVDDQIKLRGHRIELGEVEAALRACPGVAAAAALVREEAGDDRRLAAYVVPAAGQAVTSGSLRRRLQDTLPAHMVPAMLGVVDTLPLTPNGKVDRVALAGLPATGETLPTSPAPRTPLEESLRALWQEVLHVPDAGIHDNFFDCGGHSLTATLLLRRVERLCERPVPLTALFENPTVAGLAGYLERSETVPASPLMRIHPNGGRRPFFFLHGDFEGGGLYCLNLARSLGPSQPFYALAPQGMDGQPLPDTLEEMAAECVQIIQSVQPRGPYLLGGYCNGGLTAFEIARQLQAAGEEVRVLWLIEVEALRSRFKQSLRLLTQALAPMLRLTPDTRRQFYVRQQERWMPPALALKDIHDRLTPRFRRGSPEEEADIPPGLLYAHLRRHTQYVMRPYNGPLTLLRATEFSSEHVIPATTDWQEMTPQARTVSIPGDHFSCLTKHIDALADVLASELAAAAP